MPLLHTLSFIANHPLNRHRRLRALGLFAWWQCRSRLFPGPITWDWIEGTKFHARRGEGGVTGNLYAGLHEFEDMSFVLHWLKPDDLFIDVGANVGAFTILASGVRKARTIAFEPVPETFARLVANVSLNNLSSRVALENTAVGASPGVVSFTQTSSLSNHAVAPGESPSSSVEVPVVNLDSAVAIEKSCIIKIDVEGFECEVLRGAANTLRNPKVEAVLVEMIGNGARYGFDESTIPELMRQYGFLPYSYDPFTRTVEPIVKSKHHERNVIFIRNLSSANARVACSHPFQINGLLI